MTGCVIVLDVSLDTEGQPQLTYDADTVIRPGDRLSIAVDLTGYAFPVHVDLRFRPDNEPPVPCTMDRLLVWLQDRGLDVTRADALHLVRIFNGSDV